MSLEQKYVDLINADIDGEIHDTDKAELDAFLDGSEEGRALHAELAKLTQTLDALDTVDPPGHLRHLIMNQLPAPTARTPSRGFLRTLIEPALRYAASFVAGVLLTMSIFGSQKISDEAFNDVTGLVGTISDPASLGPAADSLEIETSDVAGTVNLRSAGSLLVLDFDLAASREVEILADYSDRSIWFNGFAQLESSGTSVSAETGQITLSMEGKRRYAVFLHNKNGRDVDIDLRFMADGELLHASTLNYSAAAN